jgi:hypothetical protein
MKRSEVFQSKYLHCEDLGGKPVAVTISKATFELLKSPNGEEQHKTVLYFNGAKKSLPLNRTNWDSVAEICGDDTDGWAGSRIELFPSKTELRGKPTDCIRIRPPQQQAMPLKQTAKKPPPPVVEPEPDEDVAEACSDDLSDEIPF